MGILILLSAYANKDLLLTYMAIIYTHHILIHLSQNHKTKATENNLKHEQIFKTNFVRTNNRIISLQVLLVFRKGYSNNKNGSGFIYFYPPIKNNLFNLTLYEIVFSPVFFYSTHKNHDFLINAPRLPYPYYTHCHKFGNKFRTANLFTGLILVDNLTQHEA